MAKSRDAFRTISEVSDVLDTPAHVLRFWESKFNQIKPVKRAGGRRYYRPDDLALLASIKHRLHDEGLSIKEAQKLIRESGVKTVVAHGHALLGQGEKTDAIEATVATPPVAPPAPVVQLRPVEDIQSNLFSGAELPEQIAPRIEITGATAVPDPDPVIEDDEPTTTDWVADAMAEETPAPKATPIDLPPPPQPRDNVPARLLATLMKSDPAKTRGNTAQIAPLVARLTALRDEMRHPW